MAAVTRNGVIGADGGMPWHLPEDLRHFKAVTMGKPMVMGRRTFDSIGRALPGRRSIVVTRNSGWHADGVETAPSLEAALRLAGDGEITVTGGGEIYRQAMPFADWLEITHIERDADGDVTFPEISAADWEQVGREQCDGFAWVSYRRRAPGTFPRDAAALAGAAGRSRRR